SVFRSRISSWCFATAGLDLTSRQKPAAGHHNEPAAIDGKGIPMSMKQKLLVCLMALIVVFGGGALVGYRIDPGVDPQDNIQTVFTPYDDGIGNYLSFLDRANESVYIADYSFTDPRIVDKLIELKTKRKVDVHLLLDLSQTQGRSGDHEKAQIDRLKAVNIEVVVGTSEKSHAIMHDKYTVVDGVWVESGSWNYTKSANDQANVQDYVRSQKRATLFMA